jgi:HlyD family secretion protein
MEPQHLRAGLLLITFLSLWAATGQNRAAAQAPGLGGPVPVVVEPVAIGEIQTFIFVTGTVAAIEEVTIRSEVSEQIIMLRVSEGDFVQLGEIVCELDKINLLIAVDEARARLASARAYLEQLRAGSRPQEIRIREAEVEERTAIVEKARLRWKRLEQLFGQEAASQEEVDNARLDYVAEKARLESATAALALAREGPRQEEIARAEADARLRRAELDRAEEQLSNATIVSPIPGFISKKFTDQFAYVSVGDNVLTIVNIDQVKIKIDIPGELRPRVKLMMPVEVRVDPMPDQVFNGFLVRINPQADIKTRNFPAEVVIDNMDALLNPGMFARMRIITGKETGVTLVPVDAIVERGRNSFVFVIKEGIARMVRIEPGSATDSHVQVLSGEVRPGDLVVVRGNDLLRDKMPVVIVKPEVAGSEGR